MTTSLMSNRKEDPEKMMPRVVVYIGLTLSFHEREPHSSPVNQILAHVGLLLIQSNTLEVHETSDLWDRQNLFTFSLKSFIVNS